MAKGNPIRNAFRAHRCSAARRGIEFKFTYAEWVNWWGDDLDARGSFKYDLCMCRRRDQGAYEPSNVYKATRQQNSKDAQHDRELASARSIAMHRARREAGLPWHLDARGDGHPKSKAVLTPAGRFGSAALAAEHYGVTRAGLCWRIKHLPGYIYEADDLKLDA